MDPAMSQLLTATLTDNNTEMAQSELSLSPDHSPIRSQGQSPRLQQLSPDTQIYRQENRLLKGRLQQLQNELLSEQEVVTDLRKRLNCLERERIDGVTKANEQVTRVESDVTRMRAAVEKGEAVRQNLEYELAKMRRDMAQDKRNAVERENMLADANDTMKQKVSDLSHQIEHLCQELEISKSTSHEEAARLQYSINEKELQISSIRSERDVLEAEKEKVEMALTQQEQSVRELENRIKELENERRSASDGIRRQVGEVELMKEREQRLMRDLEAAMVRIKTLEEAVESERASHLESKFNSEIIQLRIRDLEGALDVEKNSKAEAVMDADKLKNQLKELQQLCDEQQRESLQSREKLEKAEKEYALVSQQLQSDLDKKNDIINKLSKQLELHQKNFDELKEELNKAKMRQIYLEETYGGNMRELELLLSNFNFDGEEKKVKTGTKTKKGKEGKHLSPSFVLESLRHTLLEYKKRLNNTASELANLKAQHEQVAKESSSYKSMIWSKDKALEQTTQGMTRTSKELQQLRAEINEKEQQNTTYRKDLDKIRQALEQEHAQHQDLKEQMVKVATKCKTDEQAHIESLHGVYQQLLTGRMSGSGHTQVNQSSRFTWNDLIMLVQEEVANMMHSYHRTSEKLQHIENVGSSKDEAIKQLQQVHEDQMTKLEKVSEDKGEFWQQQKAELEEHYGQLLAELHNRQKKTQSLADQAWERVRVTQTIQQGLEAEVGQLRQQVSQFGAENNILLTTCALLTGAIYPLYARCAALAKQRHSLSEQNSKLDTFKMKVQELVGALDDTEDGDEKQDVPKSRVNRSSKKSGLLRFRQAVIAVLAANRIVHLSKGNCRMFTAVDTLPGMYSAVVCAGGLPIGDKSFTGVSSRRLLGNTSLSQVGEKQVAGWLASPDLLNMVITTMTDLQTVLNETKDHGVHVEPNLLTATARACFTKFMCHLPGNFASVFVDKNSVTWEKNLLTRVLGQGLNRALSQTRVKRRDTILDSHATFATLQSQILDFTKRLHTAEVERRDLRIELSTLRHERQNWLKSTTNSQHMSSQIDNFREQLDSMVAREQFDSVCKELDNALSRERQAQSLLNEQSRQLQSVTEKYNRHTMNASHKEQNLIDTTQELKEVRQELRKHEQVVRQLTRQITQIEQEKSLLQANINDAENALRTAAKDKEVLTSYIKAVEKTIDTCKISSGKGQMDLTPILSPDLIPRDTKRAGPELSACQLLVTAFVDAQSNLNKRIRGLQEELSSSVSHINSLKRELSAACQRECDQPIEIGLIEHEPTKDTADTFPSLMEERNSKTFKPLLEDTNDSFVAPPRASITNQSQSRYSRESASKPRIKKVTDKMKKTKSNDATSNSRSSSGYGAPKTSHISSSHRSGRR